MKNPQEDDAVERMLTQLEGLLKRQHDSTRESRGSVSSLDREVDPLHPSEHRPGDEDARPVSINAGPSSVAPQSSPTDSRPRSMGSEPPPPGPQTTSPDAPELSVDPRTPPVKPQTPTAEARSSPMIDKPVVEKSPGPDASPKGTDAVRSSNGDGQSTARQGPASDERPERSPRNADSPDRPFDPDTTAPETTAHDRSVSVKREAAGADAREASADPSATSPPLTPDPSAELSAPSPSRTPEASERTTTPERRAEPRARTLERQARKPEPPAHAEEPSDSKTEESSDTKTDEAPDSKSEPPADLAAPSSSSPEPSARTPETARMNEPPTPEPEVTPVEISAKRNEDQRPRAVEMPQVGKSSTMDETVSAHMARRLTTRLGQLLLDADLLSEAQLSQALSEQLETGEKLGSILVNGDYVSEDDLLAVLAEQHGVPTADLESIDLDPRVTQMIPADMARRYQLIPMALKQDSIDVAMVDPTDFVAMAHVRFATGLRPNVFITTSSAANRAMGRLYGGEAQQPFPVASESGDPHTDIKKMILDRDALLLGADQDPRKFYELAASIDKFVDVIIRMARG